MCFVEWHVGCQLEVEGHALAAGVLVDRDVMDVADQRLRERHRERPVTQVKTLQARLEVDDDIGVREHVPDSSLDVLGSALTLDDRLARRYGDNGIGEVLAARLPYAQTPQLDVIPKLADRR